MKTIVVGYDESEPAERALSRAADLAAAFGAELIVTSVAPVLVGSREMGAVDPADPPQQHQQDLDRARTTLEGRGIQARYELTVGDPASAIVELADSLEADLIVVGTRQPNLISSILGSSVSGGVKRKAHTDVLIVQ